MERAVAVDRANMLSAADMSPVALSSLDESSEGVSARSFGI